MSLPTSLAELYELFFIGLKIARKSSKMSFSAQSERPGAAVRQVFRRGASIATQSKESENPHTALIANYLCNKVCLMKPAKDVYNDKASEPAVSQASQPANVGKAGRPKSVGRLADSEVGDIPTRRERPALRIDWRYFAGPWDGGRDGAAQSALDRGSRSAHCDHGCIT